MGIEVITLSAIRNDEATTLITAINQLSILKKTKYH